VVLLLLWPLLVGDTLFYRDLYRQHFGTANLIHTGGLASGVLWDSLVNGGQPLLANPNRFLLYPTRLLYLGLSPRAGINWEIALHFLLGGFGAALLSRRVGVGTAGAAVAGIAFALGGLSVSLANHLGRFLAYHWLPWIALASHAGFAEDDLRSGRWRLALPLLLCLQWLTGAAELAAMAALLVAGWVVATVRAGESVAKRLGWAAVLILLGGVMAAVQVVPAAEMVLRSGRTTLADSASLLTWSLHPARTIEMGVPGFLGPVDVADPASAYWGAGLVDFGFPYLLSVYCGASILALAAIGWIGTRRDRRWRSIRWMLGCLAVFGLVLAWGRFLPLVGPLLAMTPGVNLLRFPVKALVLTSVPLANSRASSSHPEAVRTKR
jgi:hypothetical protein